MADYSDKQYDGTEEYGQSTAPIPTSRQDDEFIAPDIDITLPDSPLSDFEQQTEDDDSDGIEYQESISDIDEELSVALQRSATPTEVTIPKDEDDEPKEDKKKTPDKEKEDKIRPIDNRFDFLELFVFTLVTVLLLTTFVFRHSIVDGGSMENTLYDGEHLIISDLFYTPERGDIIVFEDYTKGEYSQSLKAPLVKRVIGLAGDTVRIYSSGEVYVNGELLNESYTEYEDGAKHLLPYFSENAPDFTYYPHPSSPVYIECTVPDGELFVMGDHRDASTDSRVFGTIKEESVLGKVILRFYPFDKFGGVD